MSDQIRDPADIGTDGSEHQYSQASPPSWDKSERADRNLPGPSAEEWETETTKQHPGTKHHDGAHR